MNPEIQATIASLYNQGLVGGIETLAGWKRRVYLLVEIETYISMEGLEGFFRSPLAAYATEVVDALVTIGAEQSAQLMVRANALLASAPTPQDALNSFSEEQFSEFDSIGDAFLKNPDRRGQLLEDYVKRTSPS